MKGTVINTRRTTLRSPVGLVTPKEMAAAMSHPDTIRYMSAIPTMDYRGEDAEGFLACLAMAADDPRELQLGVFLKDTGSFIGMCSLENIIPNQSCELGYWLCRDYVGQGLMSEAAEAVICYAKEHLCIKQINAFVITEHRRSAALLERLGFIKQELLENDVVNKGAPAHRYRYSKTL